jgi:hypothetical protein
VTIEVEITGRGEFLRLAIEAGRMDQAVRDAVRNLSRQYREKAVAEIRRAKSGKAEAARRSRGYYRRVREKGVELFGGATGTVSRLKYTARRTGAYRASRPGEAPASLTGTLARSVRAKYPSRGSNGYGATIYANRGTAWYRHLLEFGTRERFMRQRRKAGAGVASSHVSGRSRAKGAAGKSVGRVLPRPLWTPMQARLQADMEAAVLRALAEFK